MRYKLKEVIEFNPKESLPKGTVAKKVAMEKIEPFCRDIPSFEYAEYTGGTKFRNGDTIMARITPCLENGKTAKVGILEDGEIGFGSTEYIVFRARKGITDENFVYYLVCSPLVRDIAIKSMVGTSGRQRVQTDVVENIEIELPGIVEQRKIGEFLKLLDDKILLNKRINDNLEQQVQALFSEFYSRASDRVPFTSLVKVLGGGTPKTGEASFWNGEIPFFTPKDAGVPYTLSTEKSITQDGLDHCNSRLYPINTVFVTARGTVGKVALAGRPMAMNQSCYALVGIGIDQLLVYFYTLETVRALKHKASGAVFDAIITKDFETETISRLTDNDAKSFMSLVQPIYASILNNSVESQQLAELRDTLLPRLMSGEIDVSSIDI